jgi:pimeloyl-ACP methyl ester carboxylesterase
VKRCEGQDEARKALESEARRRGGFRNTLRPEPFLGPLQDSPEKWEALRLELEGLPSSPIPLAHPRNWWFLTKRVADLMGHATINRSRFLARVNPYPKSFRHVRFRTQDGVHIAGWLGDQHRTSPSTWGLILVPGMFATKDDTVHKRRAIWIHRHWRIPVFCIDLRAFGESTGIATAGWKEAMDIHGAAHHLVQETGVRRVAVMAESLGGAAALNALALDSQSGTNLLTGGVLAWSAFVDAKDAVAHISTKPPRGHPFSTAWGGFRRLLAVKSMGAYTRFDEYLEDVARVNGLKGAEELYDLANPKWKVPLMKHPALIVHAIDDAVVPVRHARRMQRYAEGHPHIQTLIKPWGNHTMFEALDRTWYWEVVRRYFGAVNEVELPSLADA